MSSSSDDYSDEDSYILFKDREDWRDVIPVNPEDNFEHEVVRIAYSEDFKDCFDYFRAICEKDEYSERALELTEECIKRNHANYSVWEYRRRILKKLGKKLEAEYDYTQKMLRRHIKNFQIWHHRQVLCEWANDGSREKAMTELIFKQDQKNYHAWQHRQWVVKRFGLYDGEIDFTRELLIKDVYNNSAWNHLHFCIQNSTGWTEEIRKSEISFVLEKLEVAIDNECSWNYLRAIQNHILTANTELGDKFVSKLDVIEERGNSHKHLAAYVADYLAEKAENDSDKEAAEKAVKILTELSTDLDPIRRNYWNYLSSCLSAQFQ